MALLCGWDTSRYEPGRTKRPAQGREMIRRLAQMGQIQQPPVQLEPVRVGLRRLVGRGMRRTVPGEAVEVEHNTIHFTEVFGVKFNNAVFFLVRHKSALLANLLLL